MSFLNTDLPSSDEEDDDYKPEQDKTAEAEDRVAFIAQGKRPREEEDQEDDHGHSLLAADAGPRAQMKKAKIDHLWDLLNSRPGSKSAPATPHAATQPATAADGAQPADAAAAAAAAPAADAAAATAGAGPGRPAVGPSSAVHLASLCKTVGAKERKKVNSDLFWMRNLGLAPKQQQQQQQPRSPSGAATSTAGPHTAPHQEQQGGAEAELNGSHSKQATKVSEEARALAAEALAAAREGGSLGAVRNANKVTITQTRRFAGKDIQVAVQVDRNSKEAAKAAQQAAKPPPSSGLDAFLAEVEKKKKVNVLDKTKADWQQLKASNAQLEEELEAHKRSGAQYLDKVGFLKRAELREYEAERDTRLAADVRTRGRL